MDRARWIEGKRDETWKDRKTERERERSARGRTRIFEAHVKVDLALLLLGSILTSFNAR